LRIGQLRLLCGGQRWIRSRSRWRRATRLAVGAPADIVTLPAAALPLAVVERPARSRVFKRGRLVHQATALAS
jgi:cytosine/adenosine deaminase-related metal-dependent hydrolase